MPSVGSAMSIRTPFTFLNVYEASSLEVADMIDSNISTA